MLIKIDKMLLIILQVANKIDNLFTSRYISLNAKWSLLIGLNGGVYSCFELLRPHKVYIKEKIAFVKSINTTLDLVPDNNFQIHTIYNSQDLHRSSRTEANNINIVVPRTY